MARIIIADDHAVLREGLRSLLGAVTGWEVVAEASDGLELLPLVEQLSPDLVVIDLAMPNLGGIEAISRMKRLSSPPKVLVLSAKEDDFSVSEALEAGANAYVPKSSHGQELEFAIKAVLKGQTYISPSVCASVVGRSPGERSGASSPLAALTSREREVMKLLSQGHPNRKVAKLLHISPRTIDSHRSNIMKKLGVTSNAELVQLAIKYGLVE